MGGAGAAADTFVTPKYAAGPGESGTKASQSVRGPVDPKLKPPVAYTFFTVLGLVTVAREVAASSHSSDAGGDPR